MDNSTHPKISIVTIGKNAGDVISGAIESVARQKYQSIEVIVIDSLSTDNTSEIVRDWKPLVTRFVSEPDDGISDALNKGIKLATGELVGIVHADDRLADGALSRVVETYLKNGRPEIVHGNCIYWDHSSGTRLLARPDPAIRSPFRGQFVKHSATFVTKKAYDRFGGFSKAYRCSMDYDLVLRMYLGGARFAYVDATLALTRMAGVSMRLSSLTRRESRAIAIAHGCPRWRAGLFFWRKTARWAIKTTLDRLHLGGLVNFYRMAMGRSKPIGQRSSFT